MIYQFLFVFFIFIGYFFFSQRETIRNKHAFIIYVCIIMTLQSGLRNVAVGADTFQYYNRFILAGEASWSQIWSNFGEVYIYGEGKDAGYPLLEKLFYTYISEDYQLFLFTVAVFLFSTYGILLNRFSRNTLDVLIATAAYYLLFYSFFSITGIRQTISTACSIHCFLALLDKKYLRYILFFIPAFFIHKSAAIILVFPLLLMIKDYRFSTLLAVILFFIALFNRDFLVNYFRELAEYEVYHTRLPYRLMIFYFIISVCIFVYIRRTRNSKEDKTNIERRLFNMYFPAFSCIPLLGWDSLFMREILYFAFYGVFLIASFLSWFKERTILWSFIIFCFTMFALQNSDYGFFWQEMDLPDNYK